MDLDLTIITPERKHHLPHLRQFVFQSLQGEAGLLPGHAPLLSLVDTGVLRAFVSGVDYANPPISFAIGQGSIRAIDNHAVMLTQRAEREDELDADAARAELDEAEATITTLDPILDAEAHLQCLESARYAETVIALHEDIATRHPDLTLKP